MNIVQDTTKSSALKERNNGYQDPLIFQLIEQLARLEHDQWVYYSKNVAKKIRNAHSLNQLQDFVLFLQRQQQ